MRDPLKGWNPGEQQLPASPDAFMWLRLYQCGLDETVPTGRDDPLWRTRRRPLRPLTYHAARDVRSRGRCAGRQLDSGRVGPGRGSVVKFYASRFQRKVFGLLDMTFTPDAPPPFTLSEMFFTDPDIQLVFVDCDTLTAPNLQATVVGA